MSRRLRVALVIPSLHGGGAERTVRYLVEHLDPADVEVCLVLFSAEHQDMAGLCPDIPVVSLGKRSRWSFPAMAFRLRGLVRAWRPDVVTSFLDVTNVFVVAATLGQSIPRLVLNERNFPNQHLRRMRLGRTKLWLLRWAYRRADLVICNSRATAESLVEDFGMSAERVTTIYNAVPLERVRRMAEQRVSHPFFARGLPVVVGAGRLVRQKRFDLLIRAFARARNEAVDDARLIIVGEGPERRSLLDLASRLGVGDRVALVGHQRNPYAWLQRGSVFVLSSDYEGFPNVVLEAMACGVPVVATDCPAGPAELITDGVDGSLVPVGDDVAMATALRQLLDDGNRRLRYVGAATRRLDSFGMTRFVAQYRTCLGLGGTP